VMGVGPGLASVLTALGRESATVDPAELSLEDLNRFAAVIVDSKLTATEESAFVAGAWKLAEFVASGGTLFIVASEILPDLYERVSGPGLLPYSLALGSCPVGIGGGESTVNITDDPLWRSPEVITEGAIRTWANGGVSPADSLDAGIDPAVSVPRVIVSWSGRWKVLASTHATFPLSSVQQTHVRHSFAGPGKAPGVARLFCIAPAPEKRRAVPVRHQALRTGLFRICRSDYGMAGSGRAYSLDRRQPVGAHHQFRGADFVRIRLHDSHHRRRNDRIGTANVDLVQ